MFSFTSPGMKFDTTLTDGRGPPTLRLHGQTCHRIGTLLPEKGQLHQYAQLYIFDTDHEVDNRIHCFRYFIFKTESYRHSNKTIYLTIILYFNYSGNNGVDREIVANLKIML